MESTGCEIIEGEGILLLVADWKLVTLTEQGIAVDSNKFHHDAVEAHSCVDPLMPNSFLSKNTTVNDKSTAGRFDLKVFVNCVQDKE